MKVTTITHGPEGIRLIRSSGSVHCYANAVYLAEALAVCMAEKDELESKRATLQGHLCDIKRMAKTTWTGTVEELQKQICNLVDGGPMPF